MIVAIIALIVAIGGSAGALPGQRSVGSNDLKNSSVGARSMGKALLSHTAGLPATDQDADDGVFTEAEGEIRCPSRAPFAFDPSIGIMGPDAYESRRTPIPNRFGGPGGYLFRIVSDQGSGVAYTMKVNCLPRR